LHNHTKNGSAKAAIFVHQIPFSVFQLVFDTQYCMLFDWIGYQNCLCSYN